VDQVTSHSAENPSTEEIKKQIARKRTNRSKMALIEKLDYRNCQALCKEYGLAGTGKFDVLRGRLKKYVQVPEKAKKEDEVDRNAKPALGNNVKRKSKPVILRAPKYESEDDEEEEVEEEEDEEEEAEEEEDDDNSNRFFESMHRSVEKMHSVFNSFPRSQDKQHCGNLMYEGNASHTSTLFVCPPWPTQSGILCPRCGSGFIVERDGRHGPFLGCSNFSNGLCRYTTDDPNKCPACGQFRLYQRFGRYGPFRGCAGFPSCRYTDECY